MLDHTMHVNNSEYIRWVADNLPENKQIKTLEIGYIAETRKGEWVDVMRNQLQPDLMQFQLLNNRGVSATVQITTSDIKS